MLAVWFLKVFLRETCFTRLVSKQAEAEVNGKASDMVNKKNINVIFFIICRNAVYQRSNYFGSKLL